MDHAPAVFLDRDGVLVEDVDRLLSEDDIAVIDAAPAALGRLSDAGFALVVVTNQPIVARGLVTFEQAAELNRAVARHLGDAGAPTLDGLYLCPHHPEATLDEWRVLCNCRKPRPGMLMRAAEELELDLGASYMVGDRVTDVVAGRAAGCRTALVHSGRHEDAPIVSADPLPDDVAPDFTGPDLAAVADWIVG